MLVRFCKLPMLLRLVRLWSNKLGVETWGVWVNVPAVLMLGIIDARLFGACAEGLVGMVYRYGYISEVVVGDIIVNSKVMSLYCNYRWYNCIMQMQIKIFSSHELLSSSTDEEQWKWWTRWIVLKANNWPIISQHYSFIVCMRKANSMTYIVG